MVHPRHPSRRSSDHGGGGASVDLSEGRVDVQTTFVAIRPKPAPETPYQKAAQVWDERIGFRRDPGQQLRLMAFVV